MNIKWSKQVVSPVENAGQGPHFFGQFSDDFTQPKIHKADLSELAVQSGNEISALAFLPAAMKNKPLVGRQIVTQKSLGVLQNQQVS